MKTHKRTLFVAGIFIAAVTLIFIAYSFFWFGTVTFANASAFDRIVFNNQSYSGAALEGVPLKVRPGEYSIEAYSAVAENQFVKINVGEFSKETFTFNVNTIGLAGLNKGLFPDLPPEFKYLDSALLVNNTWLVTFIGSTGSSEGFATIHKFNTIEWELVESGTGFDREYMTELEFPLEVINYIESSGD